MASQSSKERLRYYPKADLHRHLEGAIRFSTFREMARRGDVEMDLPSSDQELKAMITMSGSSERNLTTFLEKFIPLRFIFADPDMIERFTREAIEDARADGCCYLELRFSPGYICAASSLSVREAVSRILKAINESNEKWDPIFRELSQNPTGSSAPELLEKGENPIHTEAVMILSRQAPLNELDQMLEQVSDLLGSTIRGVDLAGDEINYPPILFKGLFKNLGSVPGLGLTVHAGEIPLPQNVDCAVEQLGASRIGHGVHSISRRYTLDLLRANKTVLEICPTSNVQTGVCSSLSKHPAALLIKEGIAITINSDDPGVSDIDLSHEYHGALSQMGLSPQHILECLDNSFKAAFAPQSIMKEISDWALTQAALISL